MRVLIICDHYPLSPRVNKVRNSLLKLYPNSKVEVFAWNRENKKVNEDYVKTCDQELGYGNKIKKAKGFIKFTKRARAYVRSFKPTHIHAIDIEMLIASVLILNNEKLIYEVYDIKFCRPKIIKTIREKIETLVIKQYVDGVIFASPFFDIYYTEIGVKNVKKVTLNNKPSYEMSKCKKNNCYISKFESCKKDKIIIGFIGTVRYKEILINLINASIKLENIIILIAGNGPSYEHIKRYIENNALERNVIMTGRYNTNDLATIYDICDYIWAAYPNKNLNVKYAISNKFFESILFKKKVIVAESTMLGNVVKELNIGYTVNPYNLEEIYNLLKKLKKNYYIGENINFGEGLYWKDEEHKLLSIY